MNTFMLLPHAGGKNNPSPHQTQKKHFHVRRARETTEEVQGEAGDVRARFKKEELREPAGEQSDAGRQGEK